MAAVLRYPFEAITSNTDYLQLTIKQYTNEPPSDPSYGNITNARDVGTSASAGNPNPTQIVDNGIILLPMPSNIQDGTTVGYGPDTLDAISKAAMEIGTGAVEATSESIANAISPGKTTTGGTSNLRAALSKIETESPEILKVLRDRLTAKAVSIIPGVNVTAKQVIARTQGKIVNPNMELLFNGVNLRQFRFQFTMSPRDRTESGQVKSIIRSLKKNMVPRVSGSKTFLDRPNIFELQYRKGNLNHPFLHKFKECALTNISVNYTGNNVYATYEDGTPITTIMDLTFQELVPIYDKDYNDQNNDGSAGNSFNDSQLTYRPRQETEGVGY
tara:strand:+ start:1034 stop:2023 length:990 start_codon:yes stop_codon:yes gene_type:complete